MAKELFTVSVSIDVDLIVEAESMEEAAALAREIPVELEAAQIVARARPFTELDLENNEYGWDEDCVPIGSSRSIRDILNRGD